MWPFVLPNAWRCAGLCFAGGGVGGQSESLNVYTGRDHCCCVPSRDKVNAGLKLKLIGCLQTSDKEDVGSAQIE